MISIDMCANVKTRYFDYYNKNSIHLGFQKSMQQTIVWDFWFQKGDFPNSKGKIMKTEFSSPKETEKSLNAQSPSYFCWKLEVLFSNTCFKYGYTGRKCVYEYL